MKREGHFKITLGVAGRACRVELDGQDISGMLRAVTVHADVMRRTVVSLDCLPQSVEITGDAGVEVHTGPRWSGARICGELCNAGPNGEPMACGYRPSHDGAHSWASLPTFEGVPAR